MLGLNLPPVTKNLLLLNILMFVLTLFFEWQGTHISFYLGMHYINTPLFQPYQLISHVFMHGDILHLLFNMMGLVIFGSFLESRWGARRYFFFYFMAAIGAVMLYNGVGYFQIQNLRNEIMAAGYDIDQIDKEVLSYLNSNGTAMLYEDELLKSYQFRSYIPMVGASGAIFGLSAAFAMLFPNTELMLLFPPIPIKAKFLVGGYFLYEVYSSIFETKGDHIAHLAHVGGAITGAIIILIWQRSKKTFY